MFSELLVHAAAVREEYVSSLAGPPAVTEKCCSAAEVSVQRMRSWRAHAWDDAATGHRGWLRRRQCGHEYEDSSWLLEDETCGAAELHKALKPFRGVLPASAATLVAGREVAAPDQTNDTRCRRLLLRVGGLACDTARGVASANVTAQNVMPWRTTLLDHLFLRDSAPALHALDATGTPTKSAHKAAAAAAA